MQQRVSSRRSFGALALAVCTLACGRSPEGEAQQPVELTVYAATSLRNALTELGTTYESKHGVKVVFNFGSSGDLSRQIVAGNQADLFFSADEQELERVE